MPRPDQQMLEAYTLLGALAAVTTSSQNTAEVREMVAAAVPAEQMAGFTIGQPHEIPGLVAGHIEAGADEVMFSFAFADTAGITAVGEAFGLGGQ